MGYREDVTLAYAAPIWDELVAKIQSSFLDDEERKAVIQFLDEADDHSVNEDGDHCLMWESIKTGADDAQLLFGRLNGSLDDAYWVAVFLGEDGATEFHGMWADEPFNISVSHHMTTDLDDCETWDSSGIRASYNPAPVKAVVRGPLVNDHTCTACGNAACSSQEKSCWKCGTPI